MNQSDVKFPPHPDWEFPRYLYKFFPVSDDTRLQWARQLIVEHHLYFAAPQELNDPMDCAIPPIFNSVMKKGEADVLADIEAFEPDPALMNSLPEYMTRTTVKNFSPEQKLRAARAVAKAYKREGVHEIMARHWLQMLRRFGVACFTANPLNTLLWAYYANGHKGICVRFDLAPLKLVALLKALECRLTRISYADTLPDLADDDDELDIVRAALTTKSHDWKHEDEWRLTIEGSGQRSMPPDLVDGVILGVNVPQDVRGSIMEWRSQRPDGLQLWQAQFKPRTFSLTTLPVA